VPNSAAATTSIRGAFERAYDAGQPAATQLGAIENGDQLTPVLAELTRQLPATVHTSKITVGNVTFLDATHANVDYTLTFQYQGHGVERRARHCRTDQRRLEGQRSKLLQQHPASWRDSDVPAEETFRRKRLSEAVTLRSSDCQAKSESCNAGAGRAGSGGKRRLGAQLRDEASTSGSGRGSG
jgi:hypothetical protein